MVEMPEGMAHHKIDILAVMCPISPAICVSGKEAAAGEGPSDRYDDSAAREHSFEGGSRTTEGCDATAATSDVSCFASASASACDSRSEREDHRAEEGAPRIGVGRKTIAN